MDDVIVIGLGAVGSAAARELARRGRKVVGFDAFDPPHDRGSSHGQSRIIRQAYFEHPDYVPLLRRAYELWDELEAEWGRRLFHRVGLLEVGPPEGVLIRGVRRSAAEHNLPIENFDLPALKRRFPAMQFSGDVEGVYEQSAGYLEVENAIAAALASARNAGADLHVHEPVLTWQHDDSSFVVETSAAAYRARSLVVAGGAWASRLLAAEDSHLRVLRKTMHWYEAADLRLHEDAGFPTFLVETERGYFYGFPAGPLGMKVAQHSGGDAVANPDALDRAVRAADSAPVEAFLRDWFPTLSNMPSAAAVCMYTMSPDEHFVVDRHCEYPDLVYACGLSGHGFKFAPVLGEILADLACGVRSPLPLSFLSARRFSRS